MSVSARLLDDLILELRASLGATVVVVTHELASIFAIGNNSVFLDPETKAMIAGGDPKKLLAESRDPKVREFLTLLNHFVHILWEGQTVFVENIFAVHHPRNPVIVVEAPLFPVDNG